MVPLVKRYTLLPALNLVTEQAFLSLSRIFGYLEKYPNGPKGEILIDPNYQDHT